jgi:hypothetical protein
MYSHKGAEVNMYLSDPKEAQLWQQHLKDGIEVHRRYEGDTYTGLCVVVCAEQYVCCMFGA